MFAVNDHVFYYTTGVCKITDVRTTKLGGVEERECYVLKPLTDSRSTLFVPTDQEELSAHMRPILTKEEIHVLLQEMPTEEWAWIDNERDRSKEYLARIRSCDCHDLMQVIKTLCLEKSRKKAVGKGLNTTDSKIMSTAEKLLHEEFAFVLGIHPKEVASYILERIPQDALQTI